MQAFRKSLNYVLKMLCPHEKLKLWVHNFPILTSATKKKPLSMPRTVRRPETIERVQHASSLNLKPIAMCQILCQNFSKHPYKIVMV